MEKGNILNESITTAATRLLLLQLNKLEISKRLENVLEILLGDTKVDISNVESMERNVMTRILVLLVLTAFGAGLPVLLCLCKLNDDGNSQQFMTCKRDSFRD